MLGFGTSSLLSGRNSQTPRWAYALIHTITLGAVSSGDGSCLGTLFARKSETSSHRASQCSLLQGSSNPGVLHTQKIFNEKWAAGGFQIPRIVDLHVGLQEKPK